MHSILFISLSDSIRKNVKHLLKGRYEISTSSSIHQGMRYAKRLLSDVLLIDYSSYKKDIDIEKIIQFYIKPYQETNSFASFILLIPQEEFKVLEKNYPDHLSNFYSYEKNLESLLYSHNFENFLNETFRRINLERLFILLSKSKTNYILQKESDIIFPLLLEGESHSIQTFKRQFYQNLDSKEPFFLMTDEKWDSLYLKKAIILYYSQSKRKPDIRFYCLKNYDYNMQKIILHELAYPMKKSAKKTVSIFLGIDHLNWKLQDKLMKAVKDPDLFQKSSSKIIFISAKNLKKPIEKGVLRQDLYYRMKNYELSFPSLKERREDIPLILERFINWYNEYTKKKIKIDSEIKIFLSENIQDFTYKSFYDFLFMSISIISKSILTFNDFHHMPLQGKIKNPILDKLIKKVHQESIIHKSTENIETQTLFSLEKNYIEKILIKNQNNISQTARDLGISRKTLYDRLKKYRIKSS